VPPFSNDHGYGFVFGQRSWNQVCKHGSAEEFTGWPKSSNYQTIKKSH